MASLRDIRNRIRSVKNTQKITKAMKMVAAAKLRRAQQAVEAARPYSDKMHATVSALAKRAETLGEPLPALMHASETKQNLSQNADRLLGTGLKGGPIELVVMTSDRGLCGGFNSNTVRRAKRFMFDESDNHDRITVSTIGKKGFEVLRNDVEVRQNYTGLYDNAAFGDISSIADEFCANYVANDLEGLFLVYNEFKGGLMVRQLLPVKPIETDEALVDYRYEPGRDELLQELLPTYFATELYRALLETTAAEHLARMLAMENATSNASEMVDKLTLQYNRARQAAITTELMEIIGGAEALK